MEELTSTEIAIRLHKSERTIQRWIRMGKLKVTLLPNKRYAIDPGDIEALLTASLSPSLDDILTHRLDTVNERLLVLEHQIGNLYTELRLVLDLLQRPQQPQPSQPREIPTTTQQSLSASQEPQERASEEIVWLEDDLVAWRPFARMHHIGETGVLKKIRSGKLPVVQGSWRIGKTLYQQGLDEEGRKTFHEMYHFLLPCTICGIDQDVGYSTFLSS